MVKADFAGLSKLLSSRKAVHIAKEEARRRVQADLKADEEEDEEDEGEEFNEEDEEEAKRYGDQLDIDQKMTALSMQTREPLDPHPEGEEEDGDGIEEGKAAASDDRPAMEEEDGWTTVGGKQKQKTKRRGK